MARGHQEQIPLTDRYNLCGVSLWTMRLFQRIGYMRPIEYDSSLCRRVLYHLRTVTFISTHLGN